MSAIKFVMWLWHQPSMRSVPTARAVNEWAAQIDRHVTLPHSVACVTDMPAGLHSSIEVIPMPHEFDGIETSAWGSARGYPLCLKRLRHFAPDAAEYFGADDVVCMSPGAWLMCNCDHLFRERVDFQAAAGLGPQVPYSLRCFRIRAGSRVQVYSRLKADPHSLLAEASRFYVGDDQSVVAHVLGDSECKWRERDGVYLHTHRFKERFKGDRAKLPPHLCMLLFGGRVKPWSDEARWLTA